MYPDSMRRRPETVLHQADASESWGTLTHQNLLITVGKYSWNIRFFRRQNWMMATAQKLSPEWEARKRKQFGWT